MHVLLDLVRYNEKDFSVQGPLMETIALIATAVGKESFFPYLKTSLLLTFALLEIDTSPLREMVFRFFSMMTDVLKGEFNFALKDIIPHIIKSLSQEEDDIETLNEIDHRDSLELLQKGLNGSGINEIEDSSSSDEDDDEDESIAINVNSTLTLEKISAADAVGAIFCNVKESFLPYLAEATNLLLKMADSTFEGARSAALDALWKFVQTLGEIQITEPWQPGLPVVCTSMPYSDLQKVSLPDDVVKLTEAVRKKTMEALKEEDDLYYSPFLRFECLVEYVLLLISDVLGPI